MGAIIKTIMKHVDARTLDEAKAHAEAGNFLDKPQDATRKLYAVEVEIECHGVHEVRTTE